MKLLWTKLIKKTTENPALIIHYLLGTKYFKWIPDLVFLKIVFFIRVGYPLHLSPPRTFNEKLQWLKLHDHQLLYSRIVDKYEARSFIAERLGSSDMLVPLLGLYDNTEQIDFNELPRSFVLKCTHDSGGVVICEDKAKLDIDRVVLQLKWFMKRNFYYPGREWPYGQIKPRVICEAFLADDTIGELRDYKILCFNGEPKLAFVCSNRHQVNGLNVDFYNLNWEKMPFQRHYKRSSIDHARPSNFDMMLEYSKKLSMGMKFLRVDFYEIGKQLFVGELTLYPGSGFEPFQPMSYDFRLGRLLELDL